MDILELTHRLEFLPGEIGIYIEDLATGEQVDFQADLPIFAASVIKLPVMAAMFDANREGILSLDTRISIREEDKLPGCGVLSYLTDLSELTLRDLMTLMIIVSDNSATNLVIRQLGIPEIQNRLCALGFPELCLRRRMFDAEQSARGIQNTVTARGIGRMLKMIYREELVSPEASREMLRILSEQQLNGKIPFYLSAMDVEVAHKTGEDDGITNDVGIIMTDQPYIFCFLSQHTDTPSANRLIADMAKELL